MAGSTGRPKRPLSLAAIVALVGALVACAPGDGVPPQIALAVPAAASTCSEWVALSLREDGQVVYRFKKAWRDDAQRRSDVATSTFSTHAVVLSPADFIARLRLSSRRRALT